MISKINDYFIIRITQTFQLIVMARVIKDEDFPFFYKRRNLTSLFCFCFVFKHENKNKKIIFVKT
jgi:hypothetical protein